MNRTLFNTAILNAVINGGFAWLVVHKKGSIPVAGLRDSVALDFTLTGILLGFLLAFLSSGTKVKKAISENMPRLQPDELGVVNWLPNSHFYSALIMAIVGLGSAVCALALILMLGVDEFGLRDFIIVKISYAVLLALLVDYLTTLRCWRRI